MSNKATTDAIQKDWKEREMIEVVHLNILKVRSYILRLYSSITSTAVTQLAVQSIMLFQVPTSSTNPLLRTRTAAVLL